MHFDYASYLMTGLKFLKDNWGTVATIVAGSIGHLSGFFGWIVSFILKRVISTVGEKVIETAENAVDDIQNKSAADQLKEEMKKPFVDIDWGLVDKLEKQILEGK